MKSFIKFLSENNNTQKSSKGFIGTCVNSFDEDGESIVPHLPYHDVTEFAQGEEQAKHVSRKDFEQYHHIPSDLHKIANKKTTTFLHDEENKIHMMYDGKKDIHYFFPHH